MDDKNGSHPDEVPPDGEGVTRLPRTDADRGREPQLLSSRLGSRMYSVKALVERIVTAFNEEHGGVSRAFLDADTRTKKLRLILDTADYVLAVDSIQLSQEQKADIISRSYSELFGYGPLDPLLRDEAITTIALEGADKIAVRYGHGDLTPLDPIFEDGHHFRTVIRRMLKDGSAELRDEHPYMEFGLVFEDRPLGVNLVAPPVTAQLNADIRVHPKTVPTLDDLVARGFLAPPAAAFLRALVESPHGFVIVGDTESGKTTLVSVLAQLLPRPESVISVERAGELRLPSGAQSLRTRWPIGDQAGTSFGEQISAALEKNPSCIILDEVRADEPQSIAPLLMNDTTTRQIWAFRGPADTNRLRSALGMLARRADVTQGEASVHALYRRLPFVITVKRAQGKIDLRSLAEWQYPPGAEYPDYVPLMEKGWSLELTGKRPSRDLSLPDRFWG